MKSLRCLIVDDERLARVSLKALLEKIPDVEIVGEAARPQTAIAAVFRHKPDVILLDVQMPGGGGFKVLRALKKPPAVIFVTAYDQYALRAFEVNAVDYLLKPVEQKRLAKAFERVRQRADAVERSSMSRNELKFDDMVLLSLGGSGHFRRVTELLAVESNGKYSSVLCADGSRYLMRQSMMIWERRLPPVMFVRLNRGLLVNLMEVHAADFFSRAAVFTLGGMQHKFEVGRDGAARLRDALKRRAVAGRV